MLSHAGSQRRGTDGKFENGYLGIFIYLSVIFCFGLVIMPASADAAPTNVSGTITANTTWSKANSPYIVTGNLTVNSGITLTIQAGVDVKFNGGYSLTVNGTLNAQGTAAERIRFTSNEVTPAKGDYSALFVQGPSSILRYVTLEYGRYGAYLYNADVTLDQALIQENSLGIYLAGNSRLVISNSEVRNNDIGINLSETPVAPQITNNLIAGNGTGILVSFSSTATGPAPVINNNRIYNNTYLNLSFGGPSYRSMANASSNWWGSADPQEVMKGISAASLSRVDINPILDGPTGNPVSFKIYFGGYETNLLFDNPQQVYYVSGYLKIGPTAALRVLPGVQIYFLTSSKIDVYGVLDMQGTPDNHIQLLPYSKSSGNWNGLTFYDSSNDSASVIAYCDFWNAYYGLETDNASPNFRHNKIFAPYRAFHLQGRNSSDIRWNMIVSPMTNVMTLEDKDGAFPQPLFRDNSIFGGGQLLQLFSSSAAYAPLVINAENNWWGTSDAAVIEANMRHHPDYAYDPFVNFVPFRTAPNLVTNIAPTKKFIDSGRGETTAIAFNLAQDSYVSIYLMDWLGDKKIVRKLMDNVRQAAGARQVVWNGLNDQGQRLPDGVYTFEITAETVAASIYDRYAPPYVKGSVDVLSTSGLTQSSIKPYEGQKLEIRYDLLEPAVVTLLIGESPSKFNEVATPILRQPRKATGNVYVWDGRNKDGAIAKSNNQQVYVVTETLPVNAISVLSEPTVDPVSVIKADPKAFNPMYGQKTKLYMTLTATAKVTVQIVSPDGVVVRTLVDQQTLAAGQYSADWDGKDSQGRLARSNQDYRIRVSSGSGTQTITDEGVVGVYR